MRSLFAGIIGFILGVFSFGLFGVFKQKQLEKKRAEKEDDNDESED